ncbi:MAG: nucleoside-diphosphate sugar epimerase/dehydratase [Candidatus Saccharimonadales bacterium]
MKKNPNKIELLIVGAGKAGRLVAEDILNNDESLYNIVGFIDDDERKRNETLGPLKVLGSIDDIREVVTTHNIEEVLIAVPSGRGEIVRHVIDKSSGFKLSYKIIPRQSEVLLQDFSEDYVKYIRKIRPEDLLGGEIVKSDQQDIADKAGGETVLITGAAGSIGSELSRQMAAYNAKKIIFYDWWENGMFELGNQLREAYDDRDFEFIIGDIKDRKKLSKVMETYRPTTVFHAAAYKHVPLMEANAAEAIKNNILGTKTVAELAIRHGVKKFIMVSTDKAVNPTNIMGATKRAAEQMINILSNSQDQTIFCAVRFGNVINSNGSAIPIFQKQIERGGPVTVTDKEMTRFFMTIPEAVHLILKSWVMGENNDLFVLDMGESVKIYDLAKTLITLEGYIPEEEVKIKIVGLRPGEKLYEEILVKEEETKSTAVNKVFRTQNYVNFDPLIFLNDLSILTELIDRDALDIAIVKDYLKRMVVTYKPNDK